MLEEIPAVEGSESALFEVEAKRQVFRWAAEQIRHEFRKAHWTAFWRTAIDSAGAAEVAGELGISVGKWPRTARGRDEGH